MRTLKKLCALVVVIMMLINTTAYALDGNGISVGTDTAQSKIVEVVTALGVFKDIKYTDINAPMQGSDFVKAMKSVFGYEPYGILEMDSNPEIKAAELIRIIVDALGYTITAEMKGGYPVGYVRQANELRMLDNVELMAGEAISYYNFATVLYNVMDTEVLMQTAYGEKAQYSTEKGTFLRTVMKKDKIVGQVTANSVSGLDGLPSMGKNLIKIDNTTFAFGKEADYVFKMLGYYVEAYYSISENTREDTIIYARYSDTHNRLTISAADIVSYSNYRLQYTRPNAHNNNLSVNIKPGAVMVYNGSLQTNYGAEFFNFHQGNVVLVQDDGGWYSTIIIKDYFDFVVGAVNVTDFTLYNQIPDKDELTDDVILVLDEADSSMEFDIKSVEGEPLNFSNIKNGDVLSIAKSSLYTEVIVSPVRVANFLVNETETYNDTVIVRSEQGEYMFSQYLVDSREYADINIADTVTLHISIFGKVAFYTLSASEGLTTAYLANTEKIDEVVPQIQVKMFNSDGNMAGLKYADRVDVVDAFGERKTHKVDNFYKIFGAYTGVVRYRTNSDALINYIEIPLESSEYSDGNNTKLIKGEKSDDIVYRYKGWQKCFGGKFIADSRTIIFSVPSVKTAYEEYGIITTAALDNDTDYDFHGYVLDPDTALLHTLVINGLERRISGKAIIVTEVSTIVNREGEILKKVMGFVDGNNVVLYGEQIFGDATAFDNARDFVNSGTRYSVEAGDIIRCKYKHTTNYVDEVVIIYKNKEINPAFPTGAVGNLAGTSGKFSTQDTNGNPLSLGSTLIPGPNAGSFNSGSYRILYGWAYHRSGNVVTVTTRDLTVSPFSKSSTEFVVESHSINYFTTPSSVEFSGRNIITSPGTAAQIKPFKDVGSDCTRLIIITKNGDPVQWININGYRE